MVSKSERLIPVDGNPNKIQIKSEADPENSERGGPSPPPSLPPTNENFTFQDMQQ